MVRSLSGPAISTEDSDGDMGARTLLYRLMVISPIALITWIVGTGRFSTDSFVTEAATQRQHKAISAYEHVVTISSPMRARQYRPEPEHVRRAAKAWIDGYRNGQLKPLTPSFIGDSVQEGVKSEIRSCQTAVTLHLHQLAMREARAGRFDAALEDLKAAMMVSQVLRSSDAIAETACCHEQSNALTRLMSFADQLSQQQLRDLRAELIDLRDSAPSLERLMKQTAVLLQQGRPHLTREQRWGKRIADAEPYGLMALSLTEFISVRPKTTRDMPPAIAQLYLGIKARDSLNEDIERALEQISMLLNPEQRIGGPVRLAQFGF